MVGPTRSKIALVALVTGAMAIGFSPIFVRLSIAGPTATAFYRVALALPALSLLVARGSTGRSAAGRRSATMADWMVVGLSGFCMAADLTLWHWSLQYTLVANATLLANVAPIFVTFGAYALYRESITRGFLAGLAVAVAGAVVLVGRSVQIGTANLMGDGLALSAAVFYAGYILCIRRVSQVLPTGPIMLVSSLSTAVILIPATLIAGESFWVPTFAGWAVLIGLAMVSQVAGQSLVTFALAKLPAGFASVTLLLQPVVAAILAWLMFAESLGPRQLTGGAVVLVGIYICRRFSDAK